MLRKILCLHPNMACPEETHFFRWADPFGTARYDMVYTQSKLLSSQQEMDGVSKEEFLKIYRDSLDRRELMDAYMNLYLGKLGKPNARWFDKTPQHVYGLFLIKKMYPKAKVLHIYRNPLNVVASLLEGQVMPKQSMIGAVNYWNESLTLIEAFRSQYPGDLLEIRYEDFCSGTEIELEKIFHFIGEDKAQLKLPRGHVHPEKNKYRSVLNEEQISFVQDRCGDYMKAYGY